MLLKKLHGIIFVDKIRSDTFEEIFEKEIIFPAMAIILAVIVVVGVSYAIFTTTTTGTKNNVINAGTLRLTFADTSSNSINLTSAIPQTDTAGMKGTAYTFTITNTGTLEAKYRLKIVEDENLYATHGDVTAGKVFPNGTLRIGMTKNGTTSYIDYDRFSLDSGILKAGESVTYTVRIWINYNAGNEVQGNHFHGSFALEAIQTNSDFPSAKKTILANNNVQQITAGMFNGDNNIGKGLFEAEDDYGTSYFFRGAVTNNHVNVGRYKWRIVRINGDGSIRLISNGKLTVPYESGGYIVDEDYGYTSTSSTDENYLAGYMYTLGEQHGHSTDSHLKKFADNWFVKAMLDDQKYLGDAIFCNDRTTTSGTGIYHDDTVYSGYTRLWGSVKNPILTCPDKMDAFTVEDTTNGNGYLTYPIGYLSADELVMAGTNSYLKDNFPSSSYLATLTPWKYENSQPAYSKFQYMGGYPNIKLMQPPSMVHAFFVINLKAEVLLTGTGTSSNPYTIVE